MRNITPRSGRDAPACFRVPPSQNVYAEAVLSSAIKVTTAPSQVAANPTTNRLYVTSPSTGTVTVLNGVTNQVIGTVSVGTAGSGTGGIAVDHTTNRIYVANFFDGVVRVIDGGDTDPNPAGEIVGSPISVFGQPFGLAVDTEHHRVYVTNFSAHTVSVIQGSTDGTGGSGTVVGSAIAAGTAPSTPAATSR